MPSKGKDKKWPQPVFRVDFNKYLIDCKRESSAIRIQSVMRMAINVSYYKSRKCERLWWYRASRGLACHTQRLWRGFKARSQCRRLYEMDSLPDPTDICNFDFWERCQYEAHLPRKEPGIYAEYALSGTPTFMGRERHETGWRVLRRCHLLRQYNYRAGLYQRLIDLSRVWHLLARRLGKKAG